MNNMEKLKRISNFFRGISVCGFLIILFLLDVVEINNSIYNIILIVLIIVTTISYVISKMINGYQTGTQDEVLKKLVISILDIIITLCILVFFFYLVLKFYS